MVIIQIPTVENSSDNRFWQSLAANVSNIIGEDAKVSGDVISVSNNIIVNRESGMLGVRATARQHRQVQEFLGLVIGSAKRQVLIEATIAEVTLSDRYQAGIDWSLVNSQDTGENLTQSLIGGNLGQAPFFSANLKALPMVILKHNLEGAGNVWRCKGIVQPESNGIE